MKNECHNNVVISPRVDIFENDDHYLMLTDLPGVQPEDLDVRYEKEHLELKATSKTDQPDFVRRFHVVDVDHENITARLSDGVLKLQLPKVTPAKARQVPVLSA